MAGHVTAVTVAGKNARKNPVNHTQTSTYAAQMTLKRMAEERESRKATLPDQPSLPKKSKKYVAPKSDGPENYKYLVINHKIVKIPRKSNPLSRLIFNLINLRTPNALKQSTQVLSDKYQTNTVDETDIDVEVEKLTKIQEKSWEKHLETPDSLRDKQTTKESVYKKAQKRKEYREQMRKFVEFIYQKQEGSHSQTSTPSNGSPQGSTTSSRRGSGSSTGSSDTDTSRSRRTTRTPSPTVRLAGKLGVLNMPVTPRDTEQSVVPAKRQMEAPALASKPVTAKTTPRGGVYGIQQIIEAVQQLTVSSTEQKTETKTTEPKKPDEIFDKLANPFREFTAGVFGEDD